MNIYYFPVERSCQNNSTRKDLSVAAEKNEWNPTSFREAEKMIKILGAPNFWSRSRGGEISWSGCFSKEQQPDVFSFRRYTHSITLYDVNTNLQLPKDQQALIPPTATATTTSNTTTTTTESFYYKVKVRIPLLYYLIPFVLDVSPMITVQDDFVVVTSRSLSQAILALIWVLLVIQTRTPMISLAKAPYSVDPPTGSKQYSKKEIFEYQIKTITDDGSLTKVGAEFIALATDLKLSPMNVESHECEKILVPASNFLKK